MSAIVDTIEFVSRGEEPFDLEDLLIIVRSDTLQSLAHYIGVFANVLAVPSITTAIVIGECCFQAFETHIC